MSWKEYLKENGPEFATLAAILGGFVWFAQWSSSVSAQLAIVDTKVGGQERRLDRIVQELPGIGVKLASEQMGSPVGAFVFTTRPVLEGVTWSVTTGVVDAETNSYALYRARIDNPTDNRFQLMFAGYSAQNRFDTLTVRDIESYSRQSGSPILMPSAFDPDASFVVQAGENELYRRVRFDYEDIVKQLGFVKSREGKLSEAGSLKLVADLPETANAITGITTQMERKKSN